VGRAACPSQHQDGGVPGHAAALAGGRAAARLRAGAEPSRGLWSNLKGKGGELANLCYPYLAGAVAQAHRGIDRVRRTPHLAYLFLRHAGLSIA
jgi:hypothetical protein